MSSNPYLEVSEDNRTKYIDSCIVGALPETARTSARARAVSIAEHYAGCDADALSILRYAAERGRFDEFAGKLEQHCRDHLGFVDPGIRLAAEIPVARKTMNFFRQCYQELGIKQRVRNEQ